MTWYNDLRPSEDHETKYYSQVFPQLTDLERKRIIENLLSLKNGLMADVPTKNADDSLLLASWNIKELGHLTKRLPESYYYMAEIINRFDLIAIQEIKSSLKDLSIIMRLLGKNWGYIITDITEGNAGNSERFGYIYDRRKVEPSGLSGEIVLWDELTQDSNIKQLKRTPAITGFKAGWKSFSIVNIHLHPGNEDDDKLIRKEEVRLLLKAIDAKYKNSSFWNENLIVLGDTNLYEDNNDIVDILNQRLFTESNGLAGKPTNVSKNEIYDRIFFRVNSYFLLKKLNGIDKGDVFDMFKYVFSPQTRAVYHPYMLEHKENPATLTTDKKFEEYFERYWKRNQLSDHNLVWLEIIIDSSQAFLQKKLENL